MSSRKFHNAPECPQCGRQMASRGGLAESGNRRWLCKHVDCDFGSTTATDDAKNHLDPGYNRDTVAANAERLRRAVKRGHSTFVITAAQDCTEKAYAAWGSLLQLCEHRNAHLIVLPMRYKNITATTKDYRSWWAKGLEEHIIDERVYLGAKLEVRGDIRIPFTNINPLGGMEIIGGQRWQIFAHTQVAMRTVAAPQSIRPKRIYTTGAMTDKNFSATRIGDKAKENHVTGALIVEITGDRAFVRQLNADHEGTIYDLEWKYTKDGAERHDGILSLTTGDEHAKWMRAGVKRATYTLQDSIVNTLRPQFIVRHDVLDGYAGSHHHDGDHVKNFSKWVNGDSCYRDELDQCVDHINATTPEWSTTCIVPSNHHDHLAKWLSRVDDKKDPQNAELITELRAAQYAAVRNGCDPDPFRIYLEPRLKCDVEFLDRNRPFLIGGVDHSQHGDVGVNGARGTAIGMAKTTFKMTTGHSHTPCIEKGVYQVGVSTDFNSPGMDYQRGLSSWMNTHVALYPNGKRTVIDIFGQQWRGATEQAREAA